jgi:hypothetical protein
MKAFNFERVSTYTTNALLEFFSALKADYSAVILHTQAQELIALQFITYLCSGIRRITVFFVSIQKDIKIIVDVAL